MKRLIIARHGNTFKPGETPTRVGCHTDLPLVEEQRSRNAGKYLAECGYHPNRIYAAPLKRTMESARLMMEEMKSPLKIHALSDFLEIDYGPDENKTEDDVQLRLGRFYLEQEGRPAITEETALERGKQAIDRWNQMAVPPHGWIVDVDKIIETWRQFAANIKDDETVMVVSSNGIIRFAPQIMNKSDYDTFIRTEDLKVTTAGVCVFENNGTGWRCTVWNRKPK